MDANQTRLHLLLGKSDWLRCIPQPTDRPLADQAESNGADSLAFWDQDRFELTLRPKESKFIASKGDRMPQLGSAVDYFTSDRRGAARDRFGNWYSISADRREILVFSAGCKQTTHFWSFADFQPVEVVKHGLFTAEGAPAAMPVPLALCGLAVTSDHYLVVGTLQPGGLLVFDLHAGGPPRQLCWPSAVPFEPFDMASRGNAGIWVSDRHNPP